MGSLDQKNNQCICPLSAMNVIEMLEAGANGLTKQELNQVSQANQAENNSESDKNTGCKELNRMMRTTAKEDDAALEIANAVVLSSGSEEKSINPKFAQEVKGYDGEIFQGSVDEINQWVSDRTHQTIPEVLKEAPESGVTLTNAVYFRDQWLRKFEPEDTIQEGTFHVSRSKTVKAPLMQQQNIFRYVETPEYQAIKLPFKSLFSMFVLLPKKEGGLKELAEDLSHEKKIALINEMYTTNKLRVVELSKKVALTLPRFTIEREYDLKETLSNMGMGTAFSDRADFTGILSYDARGGLRIEKFIHKTFFSAREEGVEASAASAVYMTRGGPREEIVDFTADHPFLFQIVHDDSRTILFDGVLTEPTD
jgi:serpin B